LSSRIALRTIRATGQPHYLVCRKYQVSCASPVIGSVHANGDAWWHRNFFPFWSRCCSCLRSLHQRWPGPEPTPSLTGRIQIRSRAVRSRLPPGARPAWPITAPASAESRCGFTVPVARFRSTGARS